MANHVSAEEAALRQIEKLSAQVAQEVGPPSPSWATAARAERDSADGGARDRQVTAQVEGDGTSARAPSPDRSRCSNALEGARAPKELHRVEEVEKDGGGVRGVVAFQVASPGAAPRLSRNVLLVAGKGVVRIEELDTPHSDVVCVRADARTLYCQTQVSLQGTASEPLGPRAWTQFLCRK